MGKAYLVAKREYLDNVRTKTFWIGILILPVIYVLAIVLVTWFAERKDIRKYTVIDQSGWLLDAIRKRTRGPDFVKLLRELRGPGSEGAQEPAGGFPDVLRREPWSLVRDVTDDEFAWLAETWRIVERARRAPPEVAEIAGSARVLAQRAEELKEPSDAFVGWGKQLLGKTRENPKWLEDDMDRVADWWEGLRTSGEKPLEQRARELAADPESSRYEYVEIDASEDELRKMLDRDELFAFFVIAKDPVGDPKSGNRAGKYVSNNRTDRDLHDWFRDHATRIVRERRVKELQLNEAEAGWLSSELSFEEKKVGEGGVEQKVEKQDLAGQFAPVVFVIILWISVMVIVQMLITNMIEEKSNRIIEVLLSSVSPLQLMTGKILGLACTGFSMVAFWALFMIAGVKLLPLVYPSVGTAIVEWGVEAVLANPLYLGSFVTYFVLGYMLYAVVVAGIGSVFNSLKEAQNVISPIIIVMMVPYLASFGIVSDPNGTMARVMSYIPPFTPFIMMARSAGPPPALDYVLTSVLLLASIAIGFYLAAKIFRIGILMTGKPPKLREIFRWLKAPVGTVPQAEK